MFGNQQNKSDKIKYVQILRKYSNLIIYWYGLEANIFKQEFSLIYICLFIYLLFYLKELHRDEERQEETKREIQREIEIFLMAVSFPNWQQQPEMS